MSKNIASIILVFLLGACASSGGSKAPEPVVTPPTTPTETDERYLFDEFSYNWDNFGGVSVTYTTAPFQPSSDFISNDKYKIADYGFLRKIVSGQHTGSDTNDGYVEPGAWSGNAVWIEADLNGDGHVDMFSVGSYAGIESWNPDAHLMAWINDGNGHFTLTPGIFADGVFPCISDGKNKTDVLNLSCGSAEGYTNGMLVADFNGDGISDYYDTGILYLSNNGKLENKAISNLPDMFFQEHIGRIFVHDADYGDADNDGDLDIFLPIFDSTQLGYMIDGSYAGCDGCNEPLPWVMLMNDGLGNFTANTNFNVPQPLADGNQLWATTAAIGDFDNDGFGDVAVGWFNPAFASQYGYSDNSAGAVFLNDGNNDWRNRGTIELPANWYGANGLAVDMELIDFDNDGWLDIILGATRFEPNYEGTILQFFKNINGTSFTDVTTSLHPNISKYETGGSNIGNGQGKINILDFDHDGDLDIVHTNSTTYVLINNGDGTWTFYDNFIDLDEDRVLWPVEIDGKFQYDFIGSTVSCNDADTVCTTDFFQVLDPPLAEMQHDITTKPLGYANSIFDSTMILNDLRKQSKGNRVFGKQIQDTNMVGYSYSNDNGIGMFVADYSGANDGTVIGLDYEGQNYHTGVSYSTNNFLGFNETKWYGVGQANLESESINTFLEWTYSFNNSLYSTFGSTMHYITIKEFTEEKSQFNVHVDEFDMSVITLFADLNKVFFTKLGTTFLTLGAEYYETRKIDIVFSNNPNLDSSNLSYAYKRDNTVGKVGINHSFGVFYLNAELDSDDREIYQIGFNLQF